MNQKRLFLASCLAIVATSMAFSIRADIMPGLKTDFGLTDTQMGTIAGPGLWGFAITIIFGGMLVDALGMKRLLGVAFFGHIAGVIMTIFAQGPASLYLATLFIGLANGMVEAVTNPLVATMFSSSKAKYLNYLHAWFPGGIIIGGVLGYGITKLMGLDVPGVELATISLGWKLKMALILVPTLLYGFMAMGQTFSQTERVAAGVSAKEMYRECLRPLFLLFVLLMCLTASTELGPDQWIGNLLQNMVGTQGILVLVYTCSLMFLLRQFFSGPVLSAISPLGLLTVSSILACLGLLALSSARTPAMVFGAATLFGIGKTFFWPTMVGTVAERFPKGGAVALGILGGAGMLAVGQIAAPGIGWLQDHYAVSQLSPSAQQQVVTEGGLDGRKVSEITDEDTRAEVANAQQYSAIMTYRWLAVIPAILTVVFALLAAYFRNTARVRSRDSYRPDTKAPLQTPQ